jgi:hypothetical protein
VEGGVVEVIGALERLERWHGNKIVNRRGVPAPIGILSL